MRSINPIIAFNGNAEEAFNFYRSVFGGEFTAVMRWKDMPKDEEGCGGMGELALDEMEKIMHISLPVGKNNTLMGNDTPKFMNANFDGESRFNIAIDTESKAEADSLFEKLSEGGNKVMPMDDAFWGDYFGMLVDKFGIQWMIGYSNEQREN